VPIHCPISIARLDADAFAAVDYRVMGHAFASHNELGRLCDECAYEADLKARLVADGFHSVETQVPLTVTHQTFSKTYRLDLVAESALYDLKAATALTGEFDAQLLNYILLLSLGRGKLLNFRPSKVEGRLLATSLTPEERRQFTPVTERWEELTPACTKLRQVLCDLLSDWGAFLDRSLYQEALTHFLGGQALVEQRVNLSRNGLALGSQRLSLHAPDVAFRLTAFTQQHEPVESHLRRLLRLTGLRAMQWINLNHAHVEFTTLKRKSGE
jgi:GxxExxY protein